jgi:hypothetical protein
LRAEVSFGLMRHAPTCVPPWRPLRARDRYNFRYFYKPILTLFSFHPASEIRVIAIQIVNFHMGKTGMSTVTICVKVVHHESASFVSFPSR